MTVRCGGYGAAGAPRLGTRIGIGGSKGTLMCVVVTIACLVTEVSGFVVVVVGRVVVVVGRVVVVVD
ncbi:MAG: hypothetical protein ACSLE7_14770, partial [Mycobacterium sp.]